MFPQKNMGHLANQKRKLETFQSFSQWIESDNRFLAYAIDPNSIYVYLGNNLIPGKLPNHFRFYLQPLVFPAYDHPTRRAPWNFNTLGVWGCHSQSYTVGLRENSLNININIQPNIEATYLTNIQCLCLAFCVWTNRLISGQNWNTIALKKTKMLSLIIAVI